MVNHKNKRNNVFFGLALAAAAGAYIMSLMSDSAATGPSPVFTDVSIGGLPRGAEPNVGERIGKREQGLFGSYFKGVEEGEFSYPKPSARGFSRGGFVTGGITGRDSVRALLMPGEFVVPKDVVDKIRGPSSPASAGASVVYAPQINTLALPTSTQNQRYYRDTVARTKRKLRRKGL